MVGAAAENKRAERCIFAAYTPVALRLLKLTGSTRKLDVHALTLHNGLGVGFKRVGG